MIYFCIMNKSIKQQKRYMLLLQALNGGGGGSGDEGDEKDEVESILLDPTYDWWNVWALFKRVFRSHRFKVNFRLSFL